MKKDEIMRKLEELASDSIGYGDPEARLQDERKFQLLLHKHLEEQGKMNKYFAIFNLVFAAVNIVIVILQFIFK
ncbi:MAG: hypothetical protein PVH88_19855 [Ignavibacteria bacterium]|jgi:hypothetical protein